MLFLIVCQEENRRNKEYKMTESEQMLIEALESATEFHAYLKILKELSKTMAVAVVSADTPVGVSFSEEDGKAVRDVGFSFDICGYFRACYVGLVWCGNLMIEKLDGNPIDEVVDIGDITVRLQSSNFKRRVFDGAGVTFDGKMKKAAYRGLSFYVMSVTEKRFVAAAGFDTFSDKKERIDIFSEISYVKIFAEAHPEITPIIIKPPNLVSISPSDQSENESFIVKNGIQMSDAVKSGVLEEYFHSVEDRQLVTTAPKSYRDIFGVRKFYDYDTPYVSCRNGIRFTPGVPDNYKRSIFIAGGCGMCGVGASDGGTIAANLQKKLNEYCPELGFAVFNYGFYLYEGGFEIGEIGGILNFLPLRPGDIVIIEGDSELPEVVDVSLVPKPYKYGELFFDVAHLTEAGYHEVADRLFDRLKERDFYPNTPRKPEEIAAVPRKDKLNLTPDETAKFKVYTDMLDEVARLLELKPDDNVGAVVMNCNPFTNGHRYLIETAAREVKYLFVFAVEEDKSEFPFADRYELMQAATEDIENVYVLPGGSFIISSITFKEYFNKKSLSTMTVNPSNDVRMFGGQIAPRLFIKTRFAGEEPLDPVTRQYNRQMEAILPEYGVRFCEIPRKATDEGVISASRVRELLKTRDFEEIEKLVPAATLSYLKEKFK
jgi:[citrate (pro-3S)-lyase] ligase